MYVIWCVLTNNITKAKKVFHHDALPGNPGPDWIRKFIKDQRLSIKDATKLSKERHNATRNPFIVYRFFDLLEKTVKEMEIENRPDLLWNCDETGMPHEPRQFKVISEQGVKTLQVVPGSDRDNTTVLAAGSATGKVLPRLIVHSGKQVQLSWCPKIVEKEKYPWLYANNSGWMTTDIFYKWFQLWEEKTRTFDENGDVEPRLMIYDGHLSHMGLDTLRYAREYNVTIMKLPPHTSDLLQPLDVAVFCSLKSHWGKILFKRLRSIRTKLTKAEFATLLSSDEVWRASFTKENIAAGFRKCGIFPIDRGQYPIERFSPPVLARYNQWVCDGCLEILPNDMEEIQMMINDKENSFTSQTEDGDSDRDDCDGSGDAIIEHDGVSGTLF